MKQLYTEPFKTYTMLKTINPDARVWTADNANRIQECFETDTLEFTKGKRHFELVPLKFHSRVNSKIYGVKRDGNIVGFWTNTNKFEICILIGDELT